MVHYSLLIKGDIPVILFDNWTTKRYVDVKYTYGRVEYHGEEKDFSDFYEEVTKSGTKIIGIFDI